MANDLDIRLKADRIFVKYLCTITGKSASSLATGTNMAATTLNRFVGKKSKPTSTLKDATIEKIARQWGLDYFRLAAYRKEIEEALREGRPAPDMDEARHRANRAATKSAGLREPPGFRSFSVPERDPLMDRIMGAAYEVWFNSGYQKTVEFNRLPEIVRLLYGRARSEPKRPAFQEIKKRVADMLAVAAMENKQKK